jgi:hypothetical protein
VRALVIGEAVRLIGWQAPACYGQGASAGTSTLSLAPDLAGRISQWAAQASDALGYTLNAVDFAVRGGEATAINVASAAPNMDPALLGPETFAWAVNRTADLLIRLAGPLEADLAEGKSAEPALPRPRYRWDALLQSGVGPPSSPA